MTAGPRAGVAGAVADVVIVGAGTAGCILAARLSEQEDCRVVLIEAGPGYRDASSLPDALRYGRNAGLALRSGHTWTTSAVRNAADPDPSVISRGKVVGGTSIVDGRIHLWGHPADYDSWSGSAGPWAFDEVLPYLQRIEHDLDQLGDWHGRDGPIPVRRPQSSELTETQAAFLAAASELGAPDVDDMNSRAPAAGAGRWPVTNIDGQRRAPLTEYLYAAGDRPNLTVVADAQVSRVLHRDGRAYGVEYRTGTTVDQVQAAQVVLSAGTFGTPQLLMLSGIGPEQVLHRAGVPLAHRLEGVGRNLQDHPLVALLYEAGEVAWGPDDPMLQVGWRMTSEPDGPPLDVSVWPFSACPEDVAQYPSPGAEAGKVYCRLAVSLRKPSGSGYVEVRSPDPDGDPFVYFGYLDDEADVQRMSYGLDRALEIERTAAWRTITTGRAYPSDALLEDRATRVQWIRTSARGSHGVGTCRMGADDQAVVDWRCGVHGIENLSIVDASVMPEIVTSNPAAAVMAVAHRATHWIQEALGHRPAAHSGVGAGRGTELRP
jgi:choline dehydrogenase